MDILKPKAVVGTNSWGSAAYGKVLRGESVDRATIRQCYEKALANSLKVSNWSICGTTSNSFMKHSFFLFFLLDSSPNGYLNKISFPNRFILL